MAKGKIPDFISSNNEILLLQFYENFRGIKSYALVCTQFPCSLNIPLGGGLKISEDTHWACDVVGTSHLGLI